MKLFSTLLLLAVGAGAAHGGVISFSTWSGANGQTSYTQDGLTLSTNFGVLSISGNGVGIDGGILDYAHSEINQIEVLTLTFDSPQQIADITVRRFYSNDGVFPLTYAERGQYRVNGGSWVSFTANSTGGVLSMPVSLTGVTTLEFRPANPSAVNVLYDYSLASVTTIPEPATTGLVGLALLGGIPLARRLRRREV